MAEQEQTKVSDLYAEGRSAYRTRMTTRFMVTENVPTEFIFHQTSGQIHTTEKSTFLLCF